MISKLRNDIGIELDLRKKRPQDYGDRKFRQYTRKQLETIITELEAMEKRIKGLEETAIKLFDLVHESDLIDNKIKANDLIGNLLN